MIGGRPQRREAMTPLEKTAEFAVDESSTNKKGIPKGCLMFRARHLKLNNNPERNYRLSTS
jgi:hypothetical protein